MNINEALISKYAKKIYGFAYSKTRDYHNAQDLSQEILMQLWKIDFVSKNIADMDGYIYRICQYTWANYFRTGTRVREGLMYDDFADILTSDSTPEDAYIKDELYSRLRREIMYLSKQRRQATVMFYYEGKSGKEISELLGVPASTVRWHIGKSKKILKERINMTQNIYSPKRLDIYFSGSATDNSLAGLRNDLLAQNICIVCREKAHSIEEIAQTMGISAAFIEDKLSPLANMGYLEKIGGKYKTSFFIKDTCFIKEQKSWEKEHIPTVAEAIYDSVKTHMDEIRAIGFMGHDLNENLLLWAFIEIVAQEYEQRHTVKFNCDPPFRADGTAHFIEASFNENDILSELGENEAELKDYIKYSGGAAGKYVGDEKTAILQFDPPLCTHWRNTFIKGSDVCALRRIYTVISDGAEPNEHDKELISFLAAEGYAVMKNGKAKLTIPYFSCSQYKEFNALMENTILPEIEDKVGTSLLKEYADFIEKKIPSFLPAGEREFVKQRFYQPNAFTYLLFKAGKLSEPTKEEKRCICTIAFEKEI